MVNVLDTHRVLYRNAVLRAYDAANPTTRIHFFNIDNDIGDEVYTNENGYLFYESGGRQPIECLNVDGDAIIKVSLDGGTNFDITWQVSDSTDQYVKTDDMHTMTYRGPDGIRKNWNILQADCDLPDYVLKSEYQTGIWGEQEMATSDATITPEIWTHIITILNDAPDTITIDTTRLRAGQTITIRANRNCTLNIYTSAETYQAITVLYNHVYLLINEYVAEQTPVGLTLFDITNAPIETRTEQKLTLVQYEDNEVIDVTSIDRLHNSPLYIYLTFDGGFGDCTIQLPQADFAGELQIVLDMNAAISQTPGSKATVTVGTASVAVSKPENGQALAFIKLISWYNQNSVRYHKLIVEA